MSKIYQLETLKAKLQTNIIFNTDRFKKACATRKEYHQAIVDGLSNEDLKKSVKIIDRIIGEYNKNILKDMDNLDAVNLVLRPLQLEAILNEFDPTPYCAGCNSMTKQNCECIGGAEND